LSCTPSSETKNGQVQRLPVFGFYSALLERAHD
jgi:hypothetical protein